MGENVIFDSQQTNDQQNAEQTIAQQSSQLSQETPLDYGGGEGEPPSDEEPPVDGAVSEATEDPKGIIGILVKLINSWKKKILIGGGIIIIMIIILILIIPKQPGSKNVTLTWWGLWEDNATIQPLIDDFEKQNSNIKIKYSKQDPEKYRETLLTRINNGTGPDIFRYHNTWTPMLSSILTPIPQDVITSEDFAKMYYPVIQKDIMQNGAIYGIPLGVDSLALFVNIDLLKTADISVPKDWNQFADAVKKLTVKDKNTQEIQIAGTALGTYGNVMHAPDIISMMSIQQGADLKNISSAKDSLYSALTFYTSFAKGEHKTWDNPRDYPLGNSELAFAKGQVAMYFGFSWDIFTIEQLKTNNKFKYEIFPVPGLIEGKSITVASYWIEGVSSRSNNQKEAMLFMHYLTQKETLQKFYTEASKIRLFGELYPRVDMADELKNNSFIYPFISQLNTAESSYFASDTYDGDTGLNKRANTYLENAVNAIVSNNSSVDSEVSRLQEGVSVILKENGIQ